MLSEELDLECEKLTTEWVHVEICRPMCNILNAFENKNFEIFNAVCDACDIESFKQQVIQNITTNLEELNKLKKCMDKQYRLFPDDASAIKKATILPFHKSFIKMKIILDIAYDYINEHSVVVEEGYGFLDSEKVVLLRDLLSEELEKYKKFRKENGYVTGK